MRPVERVHRQLRGVGGWRQRPASRCSRWTSTPFYLASLQEPSAFEYRRHRFFDSLYPW